MCVFDSLLCACLASVFTYLTCSLTEILFNWQQAKSGLFQEKDKLQEDLKAIHRELAEKQLKLEHLEQKSDDDQKEKLVLSHEICFVCLFLSIFL